MDSVIGVVVGGISQDKMCRFYHFFCRLKINKSVRLYLYNLKDNMSIHLYQGRIIL
jgi:hypothetical protein